MLVRRNLKQRNRFYLTLMSFPVVSSRFTHTPINKNLLSCLSDRFRSFPIVFHVVSGRFRYYETPWHNQDSNPGPPDPEAKCLPLAHNDNMEMLSSNEYINIRVSYVIYNNIKRKVLINVELQYKLLKILSR